MIRQWIPLCALCLAVSATSSVLAVDDFHFSTGSPDGLMGMASRPGLAGKVETEAADDFLLSANTELHSGSFTGLLTGTSGLAGIGQVDIEIYRIFPLDSDTVRIPNVPTRNNSPSDVALTTRVAGTDMNFLVTSLGNFTANNSVLNGINPKPNQTTGGEGAVSGAEVRFDITFTTPITLPAGHYFFVPQVQMTGGEFYWLSAPKPIDISGTPFLGDLQAWIRNDGLSPDWLRVGTDIVGGTTPPTFNAAFTLDGATVPEPATLTLFGLAGMLLLARRRA